MKRVVLIVMAFFFGVTNVVAQQPDSVNFETFNARIDSLQAKLDKLQANYDYLSCEYEINRLDNKIDALISNISSSISRLQITYYHSRFDVDLYLSYKLSYEEGASLYSTYVLSIASIRTLVSSRILRCNFSNNDCDELYSSLRMLDEKEKYVEKLLNIEKDLLDAWKSTYR